MSEDQEQHPIQPFHTPETRAKIRIPSGVEFLRAEVTEFDDILAHDDLLHDVSRIVEGDGWVCGGALVSLQLGQTPKDYDVFFKSPDGFQRAFELFDPSRAEQHRPLGLGGYAWGNGCDEVAQLLVAARAGSELRSKMAMRWPCRACNVRRVGMAPEIQLCKPTWYGSIEQVLDGFDFTVCQFGYDPETRQIVYTRQALEHLVEGRLHLHRPMKPDSLRGRMQRYERKGFKSDETVLHAIKEFEDAGGIWEDARAHS